MPVEGLFDLCRLKFRQPKIFQRIASGPQRAVEHLAHDIIRTCVIKFVHMNAVACARDNMQIRPDLAGIAHQLVACLAIINRHHKDPGIFQSRRIEQIRAGRIAKEAAKPEFPHHLDRGQIIVDDDRFEPCAAHQPVHDLAEPSDACDDDRPSFINLVVLGFFHVAHAFDDKLIDDEKQRRDQHGKCDDQQKLPCKPVCQHPLLQ